jgi:hypothetical protein
MSKKDRLEPGYSNALSVALAVEFDISPQDKELIDLYFSNGYNITQAGSSIKPHLVGHSAYAWARSILNKDQCKQYLKQRQAELIRDTGVQASQVLRELLNFAYSDITTYTGLTNEELKQLPPEIRRCIASIETTTKTWLENKALIKETTTKVKLIDKMKAIDMISKHIDFFNADNKSKSGTIDLSSASNEELNTVLTLISRQQDTNSN